MKTYTYFDYTKNREVIFTCTAETILEADTKLFEVKGVQASKNSNIGCESQELSFNDRPKMK